MLAALCRAKSNYLPQRSCKGYAFTGVCLSTGGCLVPEGGPGPGGVCSWGGGAWSLGRGSALEGAGIPARTEADPPPQERTATAADSTHPTGMHSCFVTGIIRNLSRFGGQQ